MVARMVAQHRLGRHIRAALHRLPERDGVGLVALVLADPSRACGPDGVRLRTSSVGFLRCGKGKDICAELGGDDGQQASPWVGSEYRNTR